MLWALPVGPVGAAPILLTSGVVTPFENFPHTFPNLVDFDLEGPGFLVSGDRNFPLEWDFRAFANCPVPSCPTAIVNLSLSFLFLGPLDFPTDQLHYGGESYVATGGFVTITTVSTMIGPQDGDVTLPFTLSGGVHGESPTAGSIDLGFVGGGTVRASYFKRCFPAGGDCDLFQWTLDRVRYDIEPIPEPSSWLLLGSGLLGYAARRRSARLNR
jgi:hypothetical protein